MDLDNFMKLNVGKQFHEVNKHSVKVGARTKGNYVYILYQLHSFYIERKYNFFNSQLLEINAFESDCEILNLYTDDIDLSEL